MRTFSYARPECASEAVALLQQHGSTARLLAGGTDLLVGIKQDLVRPEVVIDVKAIKDLPPRISFTEDRVTISATAQMSEIVTRKEMVKHFPALVEATSTVGSIQIRNRATLVGNICHASPAADTVPALLIYGARVSLIGPQGVRDVPLRDFILAPKKIDLRQGELVTAISMPLPGTPFGAAFSRMTRRRGVDLATLNVCCSVDSTGIVSFAFGAVGPRAFVVTDHTRTLADPQAPAEVKLSILEQLIRVATPISDVRASAEYRQAMLAVLSRRTLARAIDQLSERAAHG